MKKNLNKHSWLNAGLGAVLILGVSGFTVLASGTLLKQLNADTIANQRQYLAEVNAQSSRTGPEEPQGNDNDDVVHIEPSEDDSSLVTQSSTDTPSTEEELVEAGDTTVSTDDVADVTYPYYVGLNFVVVDPDGNMVYIVKKGDTLSKISGMVGYSVDELAEYNHIKNVNLIYVNESIRIPASEDLVESVKAYLSQTGELTDAASTADGTSSNTGVSPID